MNTRLTFHLAHARLTEFDSTAVGRHWARAPARSPSDGVTALFAAMFAAQAGLLSLGTVLAPVARELDVSIAAAGQLRTLSGLAGGAAAVAVALLGPRLELRRTLITGHAILAVGAIASAATPNLVVLAV
jgi:predicted MFS family arabinose efflux permease